MTRVETSQTRLTAEGYYKVCDVLLGKRLKRNQDISVARAHCYRAIDAAILEPHREELKGALKTCTSETHAIGLAVTAKKQYGKPIDWSVAQFVLDDEPRPKEHEPTNGESDMPTTATSTKSKKSTPKAVIAKGAKSNGKGRPGKMSDDTVIISTQSTNPRKQTTDGFKTHAIILKAGKKGIAWGDLRKAGGRSQDVNWDADHGWLKIVPPRASASARASGSAVRRSRKR